MNVYSARARPSARTTLEVLASIAVASLLVAALDRIAPITGLTVVYLLPVLFVAIRRGEVAGLVTAALSVLTMNFFFIEPRYRLTITESEHVVTLAVFLVVAVVVGRLASSARERAEESSARAAIADAREREAVLLAEAASLMLVGDSLEGELGRASAFDERRERVPVDEIGERVGERVRQAEMPKLLGSPRANAKRLHDALIEIFVFRCRDQFHRSVLQSCCVVARTPSPSMQVLSSRAAPICAPRYLVSWDSG